MLRINTNDEYYLTPVWKAMNMVEPVEDVRDIPKYTIYDGDRLLAFIWFADKERTDTKWGETAIWDAPIVFKYQYDNRLVYPDNFVGAGLYRWYDIEPCDLLNRHRPVDLIAQMRIRVGSGGQPFAKWRESCIEQAKELSNQYNVRSTMMPHPEYIKSLKDVNIAFLWGGVGPLCWKITEFLQQGVIFITPPLDNYPYRRDVYITEDFCIYAELKDFKKEAIAILKDKEKQKKLRSNIISLWNDLLNPKAMGEWYIKEVKNV